MKTNIPQYRAKKIDSDKYVDGTGITDFLNVNQYNPELYNGEHIWLWSSYQWIEIDPSTLSIHFPDMIDSEGNKIFASLSEEGNGGDKLEFTEYNENGVCNYDSEWSQIRYFNTSGQWCDFTSPSRFKVIGIQE